jgi:hypothetical protein
MKPASDENGFTLVEVLIACVVSTVVLIMMSTSVITLTQTSVGAIKRGSSTGPALVLAQDVQQLLAGAWNPGTSSGVTSDCAGGASGQSFPSGSGPFVSATSTDIVLCAVRPDSSVAYTYELRFAGCDDTGFCTLELDQEPPQGCTSCTSQIVSDMGRVSDVSAPFTFYYESGSGWTTLTPSSSTLGEIEAVQAVLDVEPSGTTGTTGTTIQRMILLPCTLANGGS